MKIEIAGENALIIYFGEKNNARILEKVQQAEILLRQNCHDIIVDIVASYASLLVIYDVLKCDHFHIRRQLRHYINNNSTKFIEHTQINNSTIKKLIELPAYYDVEVGPDLASLATRANLSIEQVINIHQSREYHVYAIGFAPGFAFLGDVDERIATPRLSTPRQKVPQGAIAIADRQTAVYPSESPGGWNIIGLCPTLMFDIKATPTMPVSVGDRVKFKAIKKNEFITLGGKL